MTFLIFYNILNYKLWNKETTFSLSILFIIIAKLSFVKEKLFQDQFMRTQLEDSHEKTLLSEQTSLYKATEKSKPFCFLFLHFKKACHH